VNGIVILGACLGAFVGSLAAVVRAATTKGMLSVYGWRGWLDLPLLVAAGLVLGALLGGVLALVLRRKFAAAGSRTRRFAVVVTGVLVAAATVAFELVLEANDPVALPRRAVPRGPRPPDVVVIIYDAVRADIVSDDHGEIADWAPRLKEFAARSVLFREAISPAPWTVPSHASLFTGLSPLDHGATEESPRIADDVETLAETLRDRGYQTVGLVANPWLGASRGFAQGFDAYVELWRMNDNPFVPLWFRALGRFEREGRLDLEDPRADKGARLMDAIASHLLARIDPDQPLFLFVNLIDAHPPYWAPPSHRLKLVPPELIAQGIDPAKVPKHWAAIFAGKEVLGEAERRVLRGLNMGEVAYMDGYLGALFDELERRGRMKDAFVAVTADHGAGLGEDRLLGSGFDLREEMLRIPMIVKFPGDRFSGTRRDDLVCLHDLHPTILELATNSPGSSEDGGDEPEPATRNGRSLLASRPRSAGLAAYSRPVYMMHYLKTAYPDFDASMLDRLLMAVRGRHYKLVASSTGQDWLYDMTKSGEREDLAARDAETRAEQHTILERIAGGPLQEVWRRCLEMALARPHGVDEIDPESREHLKRLGYAVGDDK
jgi:arylsulfatase A-like enzyme